MQEIIEGLEWKPRTCTWELTLKCNLDCGHCGSRAGASRPREMTRETALRVVGELAAMGCRRLSLSGGEPTTSPYWSDVASEGARLGMAINMITNGLTSSRDLVRQAKDAGLVSLGVSLEGLEEEHDRNRRRAGLFRRVMDLIEHGGALGLPIGVITTVTKGNVSQLEELHDLLAGRVYVWQLQLGAKMGNLSDHCREQVEPEDLLEIVPLVAKLIRKRKVRIHVADNLGYYGPYEEVLRTRRTSPVGCWIGCYAGCRHLGIESDGGVKGCLSLQSTRATEGNLQRESLLDIWWKPGAFSYNRQFAVQDLTGFCLTCEHAAICRGGCLSMRSCEGGGENPFCYHRVATLAARKNRPKRRRYVPMVVAPAALAAAFGLSLGCGAPDDGDTGIADAYGFPPPDGDADADSDVDADTDADSDIAGDAYGLPSPDGDADADWDFDDADLYGLDSDIDSAIDSDIPDPDGDIDVEFDADFDADGDPDPDAGSWYGMPE